ncbi:MAG: DeoR/GlpR family DNA-binding transcription regulator [Eubacteriales bacterium]|nr:DeoR/GlpR family DNA-binding transcription regulator [Eubacteriales bacterium]
MLTETRHMEILKLLKNKGSVTIQELKEYLDASESTIRRDLNEMHDKGELVKVFGGAVLNQASMETREESVSEKGALHRDQKLVIAQQAAKLIEEGDFVYLDAGTTTGLMIPFIEKSDVTFVTNAVAHALMLAEAGHKVIMIGGELKSVTEAIVGEEAYAALQKYNFTKGFFGVNGIDRKAGFTTPDVGEARIKRCAMQNCKCCYVLSDSSKFNRISPVTFGDIEDAVVLTDEIPEIFSGYTNIKKVR